METRDMVRMANQIAAYFEPYSKSEAMEGIANHIQLFWEPRMRKQLQAHLDAGGEGLAPMFIAAMQDASKTAKPAVSKKATTEVINDPNTPV